MYTNEQIKRQGKCEQELLKANEIIAELTNENEKLEDQNKEFLVQLKLCRAWCKETLRGETDINDKWFQSHIDQIDKLIGHEETCPHCNRLQYQCEKQTKLEKNPITYWLDANWGLSCDECWYVAHPESDESEDNAGDDASVNTQEECCECCLTEKQYNKKKGYEQNLSTLHYISGNTYCPDCRHPENNDDDDV